MIHVPVAPSTRSAVTTKADTVAAWVLFIAIKGINKLKREEPATPAEPTAEVKLLTEIRDLLRK